MKLSERMKYYENLYDLSLLPRLPIIIRLDGCSFSKWTSRLERPFDARLSDLMIQVTRDLVKRFNAVVGYTVSDEITLILPGRDSTDTLYRGRVCKLSSISAAYATQRFNALLEEYGLGDQPPALFDSRAFAVPSQEEAVNCLLYRERDGTRNSVSMAARSQFSHKPLQGKSKKDMHDMLISRGVNWNDYPPHFKRGTYIQSRSVERLPTEEELREFGKFISPETLVKRRELVNLNLPPLSKITNRTDVIFNQHEPLTSKEDSK